MIQHKVNVQSVDASVWPILAGIFNPIYLELRLYPTILFPNYVERTNIILYCWWQSNLFIYCQLRLIIVMQQWRKQRQRKHPAPQPQSDSCSFVLGFVLLCATFLCLCPNKFTINQKLTTGLPFFLPPVLTEGHTPLSLALQHLAVMQDKHHHTTAAAAVQGPGWHCCVPVGRLCSPAGAAALRQSPSRGWPSRMIQRPTWTSLRAQRRRAGGRKRRRQFGFLPCSPTWHRWPRTACRRPRTIALPTLREPSWTG